MLFGYDYQQHSAEELNRHMETFFRNVYHKAPVLVRFNTKALCCSEFYVRVKHNNTLKGHLSVFFRAYKSLNRKDQRRVYAYYKSIDVDDIWSGNFPPPHKDRIYPQALRRPTSSLFKYLYKLHKSSALKSHYKKFYKHNCEQKKRTRCPFCGCIDLLHPEDARSDYDHYLNQKYYPILAVNMKNLVPMCERCNRLFKHADDLLHDSNGVFRPAFNPYGVVPALHFSLVGSTLPATSSENGQWCISITPSIPEVSTWDSVFKIRDRYTKYFLIPHYNHLLSQFDKYARGLNLHTWDIAKVKRALRSFGDLFNSDRFDGFDFLKKSICDFWINNCDDSFYQPLADNLNM